MDHLIAQMSRRTGWDLHDTSKAEAAGPGCETVNQKFCWLYQPRKFGTLLEPGAPQNAGEGHLTSCTNVMAGVGDRNEGGTFSSSN